MEIGTLFPKSYFNSTEIKDVISYILKSYKRSAVTFNNITDFTINKLYTF